MSKAKKNEPRQTTTTAMVLLAWCARSVMFRRVAVIVVLLTAFSLLACSGWRKWGPAIVASPAYQLSADGIELTPQPEWIPGNVKLAAVRAGGLDQLSILDPKLTEKVTHALAIEPWIASVKRVTKHHPARVVVDVEYRRPVAMVWTTLKVAPDRPPQTGALPVDAHGVLLPPEDFLNRNPDNYLRINVGPTQPEGPVGTSWGDARVTGAAAIASLLDNVWKKLELHRIELSNPPPGEVPAAPSFELVSRSGSKVIWGHAPGHESSGEAPASEKLAQLASHAERSGSLNSASGTQELNVRDRRPTTPARAVSTR